MLTEDNRVFIWGRGLYGVLGNGTNNYAMEPELNEEIEGIKAEYENKELGEITKIDAADDYSTILTGKFILLTTLKLMGIYMLGEKMIEDRWEWALVLVLIWLNLKPNLL